MDALSDAIATMRTGKPAVGKARIGSSGATGFRFPAYDGTGFHIVLGGRCWLLPPEGDPVALGPGDVVLFPHGHAHALAFGRCPPSRDETAEYPEWDARLAPWDADADTGTAVLCGKYRRHGALAHPLLHDMPDVFHVAANSGGHRDLRAAVELLAAEAAGTRAGAHVLVPSLLDTVFGYLVRSWLDSDGADSGPSGHSWRRALADPVCAAALDALHRDPGRSWTLPELSRAAHVSRATLVRRFGTLAGQSPMTYLAWWRMHTAARLLRDTDAPLAEIAGRVGYGSPYSLSHAFTREFGRSPDRYRRAVRARAGPAAPDGGPTRR